MATVCVFCGSRPGSDPIYMQTAAEVGRVLASSGHRIVYGGASVGCMGAVANAALAAGGDVVGVIPQGLSDRERAHSSLTELHIVPSMTARKELMFELSDAYVVLPGSIGTLDELFEVWTLGFLGDLGPRPPVWIVDPTHYFEPLLVWIEKARASGFMDDQTRAMVSVLDSPAALVEALRAAE